MRLASATVRITAASAFLLHIGALILVWLADPHNIDSSSTSSNQEPIYIQGPREEDDAERDKQWRDLLFGRIPQLCTLYPLPISNHEPAILIYPFVASVVTHLRAVTCATA